MDHHPRSLNTDSEGTSGIYAFGITAEECFPRVALVQEIEAAKKLGWRLYPHRRVGVLPSASAVPQAMASRW